MRTKRSSAASALQLPADGSAFAIAKAVSERGGRLLVVGGWVRDRLLGRDSLDLDLEIYGIADGELEALLSRFGRVREVGRSFGVWLVGNLPLQISTPAGGDAGGDLLSAFTRAAARRDLRVNSMGFDPLNGELLDPYGGREDLRRGLLQATDPATFGDDPLRVLRVARFTACLRMTPTPELKQLCGRLGLAEVAPERSFEELGRLLMGAARPSLGFEFLREVGALASFVELRDLVDVPQDPRWHPEGCVWTHTLMVLDAAASLHTGDSDLDARVMWAALCHDFGKPDTTRREGSRVRAHAHEEVGASLSQDFLRGLRASEALVVAVSALVRHHLAPIQLVSQGSGGRAYRRLARLLAKAGVSVEELERLARADQLGRTTADALSGRFAAGAVFLETMKTHELTPGPPDREVVQGRHVLARGIEPGPEVGRIVARCRDIQDETGSSDPDSILDQALAMQRSESQS